MELRQLEYFVAVAEHLHFGRAAEVLSIGQPAVSQQVAKLERELGVDLLDRSGRSVRLTPVGSRFLPEARAVLAATAHARDVAVGSVGDAPARTLRIGSSAGLGDQLNAVLQVLSELLPATATELVSAPTRARLERVAAGQLDAAFVRGATSVRGVELIEVWRDRVLVVLPASGEFAGRESIGVSELSALPLRIVPRRLNPPLVDLVLGACAVAGFTPALDSHLDAPLDNLMAAVASGPPTWTVIYEPQARTLRQPRVVFLPTDPSLDMPTYVAVREDTSSRAVAALLRACAVAQRHDQES